MIFVFSGTGNSYHAARCLSEAFQTDMVEIAAAVRYKRFAYDAKGGDVGFVFPVYFFGIPSIVSEFVENIAVKNPGHVYCISTCGGTSGEASEQLQEKLRGKLTVDASYDVIMPDNAVFAFDPPSKEKAAEINAAADVTIGGIIESIRKKEKGDFRTTARKDVDGLYSKYEEYRNTEAFGFDERCVECRICEHVCPEQVIRVYHRKPVWDEDKCSLCMSCLNLCPKQALQYGDSTASRGRYFHPDYYMWSLGVNPKYKYGDE